MLVGILIKFILCMFHVMNFLSFMICQFYVSAFVGSYILIICRSYYVLVVLTVALVLLSFPARSI